MDYIRTEANGQLTLTRSTEFLHLPSCLYGFHNTETTVETTKSQRTLFCHKGFLDIPEEERICSCCGKRMHVNSHPDIYIRHLSIGGNLSCLLFPHNQLRCPGCGNTTTWFISFKAKGHLITVQLHQYTFEGIIAHATYKISAGKIEGINQKIKTLRRHGYGYPDDEYFFLKIMDASRKKYVRNQPSHRKSD